MKLLPAEDRHFTEMMGWFPDRASCEIWGGPHFRYPFTESSFREDLRLGEVASISSPIPV